jgi:hypothetical protein
MQSQMQQIDTYTRKLLAPLLKHIASQPTLNNTKINLPLTYIPEPITTLAQILSTALAMQSTDNTGLSSLAQDSIAFALRQVEEELAIVTEQTLIANTQALTQKYQLALPLYSEQHSITFFILLNKRA